MKFRFVGGKDAPEWILAEVSVLSKISCVRLKLITRQVINQLVGGTLDVDKVAKLIPKEGGFTWSDIKAALAAIAYILQSATRNSIDANVLNAELQQLGLPKENADGISRPYRLHRDRLVVQAGCESLRLPRLLRLDWRVDAAVASSTGPITPGPDSTMLHLSLGLSHRPDEPPPRTAWVDAESTPLLLAAKAHAVIAAAEGKHTPSGPASPSGASSSPRAFPVGSEAHKASQDLAMIQLGVRPHGARGQAEHLGNLLSPTGTGDTGQGSKGGNGGTNGSYSAILAPAAPGSPEACAPRLMPRAWYNVSMTHAQAAGLLAELKLARTMMAQFESSLGGQAGT